jgi:hypothetical protein
MAGATPEQLVQSNDNEFEKLSFGYPKINFHCDLAK